MSNSGCLKGMSMAFDKTNVSKNDLPADTFALIDNNSLMIMPGQLIENEDPNGGFGWGARRLFGSFIKKATNTVASKPQTSAIELAKQAEAVVKKGCVQSLAKLQVMQKTADSDVKKITFQQQLRVMYGICKRFYTVQKTVDIPPFSPKVNRFFPKGQTLTIEAYYQYITQSNFNDLKSKNNNQNPVSTEWLNTTTVVLVTFLPSNDTNLISKGRIRRS